MKRRYYHRKKIKNNKILKFLPLLISSFISILFVSGFYLYAYVNRIIIQTEEIDLENIRLDEYQKGTVIYGRDNSIVATLDVKSFEPIKYEDLPPHTILAFLAAEDSQFFKHSGISPKSIFRAIVVNILSGKMAQGGSTITQQLVRNLFLTRDKTIKRKIKEIYLAMEIEKRLSKKKILELYLSTIYLGNSSYGLKSAANNFFRKDITKLSLAESSLLAALPKAPSLYSPLTNPKEARARQLWVLSRMLEEGFITEADFERAKNERFKVYPAEQNPFYKNFWYAENVRRILVAMFGEQKIEDGLKVWTPFHQRCQETADMALKVGIDRVEIANSNGQKLISRNRNSTETTEELEYILFPDAIPEKKIKIDIAKITDASLDSENWGKIPFPPDMIPNEVMKKLNRDTKIRVRKCSIGEGKLFLCPVVNNNIEMEGAILVMDVETGGVLCMSGGYDIHRSQFIRSTQMRRQPGSAFKPIVYTAALLTNRYTPATLIKDSPIIFEDDSGIMWSPKNYDNFEGFVTLTDALAKSINNATVRIANDIGLLMLLDTAKKLGLNSLPENDLSVALGSAGVTLPEIVRAYGVFASGGYLVEPYFIERIEDLNGKVIFQYEPQKQKVLDEKVSYIMSWMLKNAVQRGTGWRAKTLGIPIAGKTGTSNESRDNWFIGFTPKVVVGIWVGKDDFTPIKGIYNSGGNTATPIFVYLMSSVKDFLTGGDFPMPQGIEFAKIERSTGLLAPESSTTYIVMPFIEGSVPTEYSETFKKEEEKPELLKEIF